MTDFYNASWLHWPQTQRLIAAFLSYPQALRFVGGAVRDTLLGRMVADVDAAITLLPDVTMMALKKAGIQVIPTGISHGTVTAVIDGKHFEITTLRKDVACDGRHADVAFTDNWREDAARRDFTMNAMYLSPTGELFDYFGGEQDAKAGCVRFIGDATQRIREDYLRILRFFRFYAHYGIGLPDNDALKACAFAAKHMEALSGERIQHEFFRLLSAPRSSVTLKLMHEHGILPYVLGFDIKECRIFVRFEDIKRECILSLEPSVILAGCILEADMPNKAALEIISHRLKLSRVSIAIVKTILRYRHSITPIIPESEQKSTLRKLGAVDFINMVSAVWAYSTEPISPLHPYATMLKLAGHWRPPTFSVTGSDLIALGFKPGKDMGELLCWLEDVWEKSNYTLTKGELLEKLK